MREKAGSDFSTQKMVLDRAFKGWIDIEGVLAEPT